MHTTEVINDSRDVSDDGPSVLGRFAWAIVGRTCVPCLLKNDNTRYVSVRIAESEVLGNFLNKLNTEVFNCVSVKSFGITEAENKLLNEINSKHCEGHLSKDQFTINADFIVKLDDLVEFYNFMDICFNKLMLQNPTSDRSNKCGFVRINDDSVVPYAVKNNQKYVPLFYFEGETESLKTKAINLENWDLAYLKFCCKVQGIKNELFASEKCLVTSLEDVKSYFPEGTKFEDYWPSKIVEMQQPTNRSEVNGNHSWVQTPHVDTSSVVPPPTQSSVPNKAILSALSNKQLHNNQRVSASAVITNLSSNVPVYQNSTWPNPILGNSAAPVSSSAYQLSPSANQPRLAQKLNSGGMHSMNSNSVVTPRTYVNQNLRPQPPQYYLSSVSVPNVSGTTQPPPPLVRNSNANSLPNAYGNTISGDAYPSHIYQNSNTSLSNLMTVSSRHMNASSMTQQQQQQQQVKSRSVVPNQITNSTVTRFPPGLTPINGPNSVIQAAANSTSLNNVSSNNVNNVMAANSRQQQQHRTNLIQSGGEIIDLSSPPHSPQHQNNIAHRIPSASNNNYNAYNKLNSHPNLPPLKRINDAPQSMKNGIPPYKVETVQLIDKSVPVINLKPYSDAEYAIPLQDIITYYFPRVEMSKLRNVLQNVLKINLYEAKPTQIQLLREHYKGGKHLNDDMPLLSTRDFESNYTRITYLESSITATERDSSTGERDAKRQKVS